METLAIYITLGAVFAIKYMVDITYNRHGLADTIGKMVQGRPDSQRAMAFILIVIVAFLLWPIAALDEIRRLAGKVK